MPADITIATIINSLPGNSGRNHAARREGDAVAPAGNGHAGPAGGPRENAAVEHNLPAATPGADNEEGQESLQSAVSDINTYVQNLQRDLEFRVDRDLGRTIITVLDSETKEVIRQIPSEEVLKGARLLREYGSAGGAFGGLLFRENI